MSSVEFKMYLMYLIVVPPNIPILFTLARNQIVEVDLELFEYGGWYSER